MPDPLLRPLVAVLGPTASGKSELALQLAEQFGGEIVNCDSLQVYRGFDAGTAKTPLAARRSIPHHLIDIFDPRDHCDAAGFASLARFVLQEIAARQRIPILAGGTGFYLRATLTGLTPGPRRDSALRERFRLMEDRRPGLLHRLLSRWDPSTAARVHPRDRQKLVRALEIRVLARRPASDLFAAGAAPLTGFAALKLVLHPEREALRARIRERTREIFARGLIEEVRRLLEGGLPDDAKPLEAIGYKEALGVLAGRIGMEGAIRLTFFATCQYAKRQVTWFRREPEAIFLPGFGDDSDVQACAARRLSAFLESLQLPRVIS